jgi:hypothetical protein
MLLSFERPAERRVSCAKLFCELDAGAKALSALRRTLKTAQLARTLKSRLHVLRVRGAKPCARWVSPNYCVPRICLSVAAREVVDHRQDSKGTRWMPWHQEPKKGVDDCDKQR